MKLAEIADFRQLASRPFGGHGSLEYFRCHRGGYVDERCLLKVFDSLWAIIERHYKYALDFSGK